MTSLNRMFVAILITVVVISVFQLSHAQSAPQLILQVFPDNGGSQLLTLDTSGSSVKLRDLAPGQTAAIDPSGKTLAVLSFGDTARKTKIEVGSLDNSQPLTTVVETNEEIDQIRFIGGQYLAYTTLPMPGSGQSDQWRITLFDVTTKHKVDLVDTLGGNKFEVQGGGAVVASALWLDNDTKRLYVMAYLPNTDADDAGLYMLELSSINFDRPSNETAMPPAKQLVQGMRSSGGIYISPDGTKLAWLFYDSQNPPANYNANNPPGERLPITYNAIALYDLAAQSKKVVTLGNGQAIEKMTWTSDGKQLLFTGGIFSNTYYITTPRLYSASSGNVSDKGVLEKDSKNAVSFLAACGDQLYFAKTQNGQSGFYAAKLNDLTQVKGPLLSTIPNLIGCVG